MQTVSIDHWVAKTTTFVVSAQAQIQYFFKLYAISRESALEAPKTHKFLSKMLSLSSIICTIKGYASNNNALLVRTNFVLRDVRRTGIRSGYKAIKKRLQYCWIGWRVVCGGAKKNQELFFESENSTLGF